MRFLLILLGLLLMAFGLVISFGTIMGWYDKTSSYPVATDIAGLLFIGVTPFAIGVGLLITGIVLQLRQRKAKEPNDDAA